MQRASLRIFPDLQKSERLSSEEWDESIKVLLNLRESLTRSEDQTNAMNM